ncbi:MAG: signal peptide peptidase SppA [Bacteroidota bacterium]|nr:signal peptide peptidase SppA [Bacteroidota bacterium]MDP3144819.1 signal peptide peptidase SppA [Bacteroidota bacterium]
MKQFFGAFFGSILGIIIATILSIVIIVGIIKSSIDAGDKKDDEGISKTNSVLKLVLDGQIIDREKDNPFKDLGDFGPFGDQDGHGLNTLLNKIAKAKTDDRVKGIYIYSKSLEAGFATIEELRNALTDFKKSGKFIYCYGEYYGQKEYYLASVANKIFLNPQGSLDWKGLSMSLMFFKNAFEKLGVEVQVFRHGRFKSAVEPFLLDKMSASNRLQSETFLNSIWSTILTSVSDERKISIEELNKMANTLAIRFPEDAIGTLIDNALYEDEVILELKKKIGITDKDKINLVDFDKYEPKDKKVKGLDSKRIAVIYASGSISSGHGGDDEIGSDALTKTIKAARLDDKIKAIVLRVNSPGGSALASDVIWREIMLAKKIKPVIVSMGNLAASGGYYISCGADRIFAQANTITGSIGVFGIIPNIQKALDQKLGITIDTVNTNLHSDVGGALRSVSASEYSYIQSGVEKVYDVFTKRVAEGRKMSQADVDSIGQGRVWTGKDALKINLVDEIGGMDAALAYAAKKANLTEYKLIELPKQKSPFDAFLNKKELELESRFVKRNLGVSFTYFKQLQKLVNVKGIQARLPFEMLVE